ncbi:MAG: MBL fold metallo-hydrolase [Thermodesulfobacteriota bacterium]
MYIKCWGSRGSIPVSGRAFNKYGGDTTCLEIRTQSDDIIIVDAGTGIRRLGNKLIDEERYEYHLLFTHAHWDHLMGFPFFKPLFTRKAEIKTYRCPFPGRYVEDMISKVLAPPNFPVKYSDLSANFAYQFGCPETITIGSMTVMPIRLSHPNGGSGYKFVEGDRSFVFLTDNELGFVHPGGLTSQEYLAHARGVDLLIHDAEYTPKEYQTQIEWGHSSYIDALELAFRAGVKRLGLFHLNQERTDRQMDAIVRTCQKIIHERNETLECFAVASDMEFSL